MSRPCETCVPSFHLLPSHSVALALSSGGFAGLITSGEKRPWSNPAAAGNNLNPVSKLMDANFPHEAANDIIRGSGHKSQLTRFGLDIGKNIRRTSQH